ncbi:MAG: YiiX family permuted papain-like enzyme [Chitinophagales bacterium]|jgi:uncharacterized protein YycO|nr:YiiX family permuted papain-like enzyme [Sphingobacteriales bacterium]
MKKFALIAICLLLAFGARTFAKKNQKVNTQNIEFKNGDIVFQTTNSDQCKAVQLATHSPYSHCGIIFKHQNEWQVLEAIGPTKCTSLDEWMEHGVGGRIVVKRLKNREELSEEEENKMKTIGIKLLGKAYDFSFDWDDDKIYCSELVWKLYDRGAGIQVGKLKKLKDFDLSHSAVQAKLKERYGDHIPYEEIVIPPSSIFESENLIDVFKN